MKYFLNLTILLFIFSCDKKQELISNEQIPESFLSVVTEYSKIKAVDFSFKKEIENWNELKAVDNFLARFKKVSPNEVLSNALELQGLIEYLRDNEKPILFNNPSFNARINILYNETLRLSDMTSIPSIKADEVNLQTEKIIDAYSGVNSKINTVLSKKRFEDAIDVDVTFIGLDSTKMDSISRKTVNENLLEGSEKRSLLNSKKKKQFRKPKFGKQ